MFILGYMLLHKLYINVAIANILLYFFTLQGLPAPKCNILKCGSEESRFLTNISPCACLTLYVSP